MLVRFFEYDTQIALDEGEIKGNILTVTLPHSAVLFLRHHASTPDTLKIRMITPGGTVEYDIQVMKSQQYTLKEIFEKNPYMAKIYPTEKSRDALEVFHLYKGEGEYFDLSQLPPFRQAFSFGGETVHETGYRINAGKCIGCQGCHSVCPQGCISNAIPRVIDPAHCIHCGNCSRICPVKAVEKLG